MTNNVITVFNAFLNVDEFINKLYVISFEFPMRFLNQNVKNVIETEWDFTVINPGHFP